MSETTFKQILVSELEANCKAFLELKRATGLKYIGEEKALRYFVRYCHEKYHEDYIPEDAIYTWIHEDDNRSQKTKSNYKGVMTEWAKYMFSLGYIQMRIPDIRCPKNKAFIPHIFTTSEMNSIWKVVDNIPPSKAFPNLHKCIPVLFRLLYSCGPRISEALAITRKDIDFDKNVITIRKAKLDKTRWLPMSDSTANILKKYIEGLHDCKSDEEPIFYFRHNIPLTPHVVYLRFRWTIEKAGIPYEGKLRGPRLHDFRHTFAVTSMNKLSDDGQDIYVSLPILSAYLGHSGLVSTENYVRLTEDRLSKVTDSIQLHLPNLFPEVKDNAEF